MTNEEAVSILEKMWAEVEYYEETEALDMAIEALKETDMGLNNGDHFHPFGEPFGWTEEEIQKHGLRELLKEVDNENDELSCSEKPNNSDLISRRDVVKMIRETNISSGMTKARLLIKAQNLPSAQENIIRCKDCEKHGSIYCTMSEEFDNGTNPEDFCSYAENACENTCDFTRMSHAKDTIYRKDAIDAVMKFMPSLTTPDGCGQFDREIFEAQEMFVDIRQALNDLPSAQPEIIRCKECKHYGYYECAFGWMRDGSGFCDRAERKDNG